MGLSDNDIDKMNEGQSGEVNQELRHQSMWKYLCID